MISQELNTSENEEEGSEEVAAEEGEVKGALYTMAEAVGHLRSQPFQLFSINYPHSLANRLQEALDVLEKATSQVQQEAREKLSPSPRVITLTIKSG